MRFDRDTMAESVLAGLFVALACSAWALLMVGIRGRAVVNRLGLSVAELIGLYFVGGLAAGAVIGFLRPWVRNTLGAMAVGYIGAMPFVAGGFALTIEPERWLSEGLILTLITSLAGAGVGAVLWSDKDLRRR